MLDGRTLLKGLAGGAVALGLVAGVALASRVEIGAPPRRAELRLALRAARARLEICRARSADELARLPAHLRAAEDCDELAVDYRLTVDVDGVRRLDRTVSHRGVRHTRPLAVEEDLEVSPGRHRIEARFTPVRPAELESSRRDEEQEDDEAAARARLLDAFDALAAPGLVEEVEFRSGRAVLVTLGEDGVLRVTR
jgi:hypothetical protein